MKKLIRSFDLRDIAAIIGLGLVAGGIAVIYWPASLIVTGGLLLSGSIVGVRRGNT